MRQALAGVALRPAVARVAGKWAMIDPPMIFTLDGGEEALEAAAAWGWPAELHCICDRDVFAHLVRSAGLEVPAGLG
jgi:hypothetical protein